MYRYTESLKGDYTLYVAENVDVKTRQITNGVVCKIGKEEIFFKKEPVIVSVDPSEFKPTKKVDVQELRNKTYQLSNKLPSRRMANENRHMRELAKDKLYTSLPEYQEKKKQFDEETGRDLKLKGPRVYT
jgi:hypothetical protein